MVHKIFEDFLDSAEQYHACEKYWEGLVQSTAISIKENPEEWKRWIPLAYADGTPFELDGNPIFDARSQKLNRAFRIIQHQATGNELEIAAWLKHYEDEYSDLPASELFINLSLSLESAELARQLLAKWMKPETTADDMQSCIANWKKIGKLL